MLKRMQFTIARFSLSCPCFKRNLLVPSELHSELLNSKWSFRIAEEHEIAELPS